MILGLMRATALTAIATVAASCGDGPVAPPPDTTPPVVKVLSPTVSSYDADDDGLVDVRLEWAAGDVDPATVTVRALDGIGHSSDGEVDLLQAWNVVQLDSTGLDLHETVENLLHPESSRIEILASDSAGNAWGDTVEVELPSMALHETRNIGKGLPYDATFCPDDPRLYLTLGLDIVALDGITFEEVGRLEGHEAARIRCVGDSPYMVFSGNDSGVMDRRTLETVGAIYSNTIGLAWSALDPGRFYTGATAGPGVIFVFDVSTGDYLEEIPVLPQESYEFLEAMAISDRLRKIYVTKFEGVRVVDFDTHEAGDTLGLLGGPRFFASDLRMSPDGHYLYGAVSEGKQLGLAIFEDDSTDAVNVVLTDRHPAIRLAISPSGARVFLTTQVRNPDETSNNYLIGAPSGYVIQKFPRDNDTGDTRWDGAVAFSSDGHLLFTVYELYATDDAYLQVYLNREYRIPGTVGSYSP